MRTSTVASAGLAVAALGLGTAVVADGYEWKARPINAAQEVPTPVGDPTAVARAQFELEDGVLHYKIRMRAPIEDVFMAHIHAGARGTAGPIVVWLYGTPPPNPAMNVDFAKGDTVAKGTVSAADFIGPLAGKTIEDIAAALDSGGYYVNIHTVRNPAGEIRGQVVMDD
jgi:hypothetical protein